MVENLQKTAKNEKEKGKIYTETGASKNAPKKYSSLTLSPLFVVPSYGTSFLMQFRLLRRTYLSAVPPYGRIVRWVS